MKNTKYPEVVNQMEKHNEKLQDIAILLNQNYTSQVCRRLMGRIEWTINEAKILCKHYNMKFEKLFREEE